MDSVGLQCRQGAATFVNTPPSLGNPGSQSTALGAATQLVAIASDTDADALSFSAMGLPPGLVVNPSTGTISGSPDALGDYNVALTVSDGTVSVGASVGVAGLRFGASSHRPMAVCPKLRRRHRPAK